MKKYCLTFILFLSVSISSQAQVAASTLDLSPRIANLITISPVLFFLLILVTIFIKLRRDKIKLSDFLVDKEVKMAAKKEDANIAKAENNRHATIATANANALIATVNANAAVMNSNASNANTVLANTVVANANNALSNVVTANTASPTTPVVPAAAPPADDPGTATNTGNGSATNSNEQSTSRFVAFLSGITTVALAACVTSFYFYKSFTGKENVDLGNLSTVLYGLGLGIMPYGFTKVASALKSN